MTRTGIRAAGIILREGKIILIHRRKKGKEYWVFPGGGVEESETMEEAVIREIAEELSLKASNPRVAFMYEIDGREHPMFIVDVEEGDPIAGTEIAERVSDDDWYQIEWVEIDKLKELENLYPENAAEEIVKLYSEKVK